MKMIALGTIANMASAVSVIVAISLGFLQISQMRKSRALFTAGELVHTIQTPEFSNSVRLIMQLPDRTDPAIIRDNPEILSAVLSLSHVYESLGVLVYHRILPLHLVDDLMGGYIRGSWAKLEPFVVARRAEQGVFYGEWMQWLAERMIEFPSPGKKIGAHIAHRKWKP